MSLSKTKCRLSFHDPALFHVDQTKSTPHNRRQSTIHNKPLSRIYKSSSTDTLTSYTPQLLYDPPNESEVKTPLPQKTQKRINDDSSRPVASYNIRMRHGENRGARDPHRLEYYTYLLSAQCARELAA